MRIIRYLKNAKWAVVLIALLLMVQAFADLSLPRYTSDLVDVGIQQGGIEDAVPESLRAATYDAVCVAAAQQDAAQDTSAQVAQDGTSQPGVEALIRSSYERTQDGSYVLSDYGSEHREELADAIAVPLVESVLGMQADETLADQQAIEAVKAEYEAQGRDMGALQINYLLLIGAQMLGITALMMIASILADLIAARVAARIAADLRSRLFARVVSFSDAEVQSFSAASLITRGTNDITQIQNVLVMLLRMLLYSPILAIGGIVMVTQTSVAMSWTIVAAVVALAVVVAIIMCIAMPKFKIMQQLIDRVNLVSREMLSGLQVVRAFNRQGFEEARFDDASTALFKTQLFTNRTMAFMMPAMMLIMNGTSVLIVWVGGHYIDGGVIQTGDMIAFITYAMVIVTSFLILGMIGIMLPRADVAAQRVNEVLGTTSSICDPSEDCAKTLPEGEGLAVEFDQVTFSYESTSEPVLRDITFTAEPGQTTAIIGATGCGKSTLLKLVERFYDVDAGVVRVGGCDVREVPQHELRAHVGYVPQKAFLFSGSIRETISYGNQQAGEAEVRKAAAIAQAEDFIDAKGEGFDAPLSQGGGNVSGGQRQRLAIARALAMHAPILLFDDSFSALDYATDARLRTALAHEAAGKTVIVVAQRISTVLSADKIVVLDEGRIAGIGTHAQLMKTCATYREIAESQLSEAELEGGAA